MQKPSAIPKTAAIPITIVLGAFLRPPPGPNGAVEKIWTRLAEVLVATDPRFVVSIIHRSANGPADFTRERRIASFPIPSFDRSRFSFVDHTIDLIYSLRALWKLPRSGIVVSSTSWLPILVPLFRPSTVRVIVDAQRFPNGQMRLYRGAASIRVPAAAVRDAVIREIGSAPPCWVVPNPIDTSMFQRVAEPPADHVYRVMYAGRIHPEKGLVLLVRAFVRFAKNVPNAQLILLGCVSFAEGGGGEGFRSHLVGLAEGHPIRFSDRMLSPQELAAELQTASVFCYPSIAEKGESFGVAPLEAMSVGVPVIVSSLECFEAYALDRSNCLVFDHRSPDPVARLADCLTELHGNPELSREIATAARISAARFSYPKIAEAFADEFIKVWCGD